MLEYLFYITIYYLLFNRHKYHISLCVSQASCFDEGFSAYDLLSARDLFGGAPSWIDCDAYRHDFVSALSRRRIHKTTGEECPFSKLK